MLKMQYRLDNMPWEFTNCPAGESEWKYGWKALEALIAAINEWGNLSHRIVRVDEEREPVEVIMSFDLSRYQGGTY